ncbi:MAG: hypothetical protein WAS23_09960 [Dokdonella sp.]|uniref:GFA family protein n=1 Tax=Dokdonella sp. TaxID=2291710 RepID=UPI002C9152A1|nr:hypothetical protein [Dokdonella sp.]HOX71661.1 hypothetical protein [Dokdonella sp.]HPG93138.1 hypothetical protein [Dokdonella sp.]HPN78213.1 hypothetical protein [Dokdonella sp.]
MQISGSCHCGNISFLLTLEPGTVEIPARACSCSFCVKHGGVWTGSPTAKLQVRTRGPDQVNPYRFGTRTAEFHVCRQCGVVPVVTSTIGGRVHAVVSVNAMDDAAASLLRRSEASFDGEGEGERLERRARHWIADVHFVEPGITGSSAA